jgi:hypothetical protein
MKRNTSQRGSEHYKMGGIEVLEVLKAKLTPIQYEGFVLGNIIKYSLRYNGVGPDKREEDLEKLEHYKHLLVEWRDLGKVE